MSAERDSASPNRTLQALPVRPVSPAPNVETLPEQVGEDKSAECRFGLPAQEPERTAQSLRAETSYRDWADVPDMERPLAAPRAGHASALFAVLKSHGVSILRFAEMIGVNERQARKYLEARSPIPTTLLDALPLDMADDFANRVRAARGGQRKNATDLLRLGLAAAERDGIPRTAIDEGFRRLGVLSGRCGQ